MKEFWDALVEADHAQFFQKPYLAFKHPIWGISTKPGFIFDDPFWDVFHKLGLHICHVTTLVNEDKNFGMYRVFDLRFKESER